MKVKNKMVHPFPHFYYRDSLLIKKIFHNIRNRWEKKTQEIKQKTSFFGGYFPGIWN